MTRLAAVKVVCEGCLRAPGRRFCVECRLPLCGVCARRDGSCGGGGGMGGGHCAEEHMSVRMSGLVTSLCICDLCDWRPASVYCEAEGSVLCPKCDMFIHSGKPARSHLRKPISVTIAERSVSLVCEPSDSESESVHDGSVVEPPTSPPSSPLVEPPMADGFDALAMMEDAEVREEQALKKAKVEVKKREEEETNTGSGGNNNGSDTRFDPASSKGASGDGQTNNGSNENASNGSNGDEGTSSLERASVCASGDMRNSGKDGKSSSRDSCSSGAVSGNGKDRELSSRAGKLGKVPS
mmetsp:Transcript_10585/g.32393  ORF Transcript_10585/g.32393 Transcript_10585/m.32393 type:complete len:296 (+) Transcript_10585:301-1188(+)